VDAASSDVEPFEPTKDDPAYWLFTSGSTGKPKGVVHLHHDFPWNCERYAKQVLEMDEDDVTLAVPKLYFGYATGTNLFFPFAVGGTVCLFEDKPTPEVLLENIEHFEPTILTTVPTSINQVVNHDGAESYDLSSLRFALSAGEALPSEVFGSWMDLFGVEILDGIGSAESFHIYITNYPGESVHGSLGREAPGYEAKIVDTEGSKVDQGEVGRLKVKGDSIGVAYHQRHEESKQTFQGDWLVTSDLFRLGDDGLYYYEGRADDVMKVSGMFVSPLEIEEALLGHEAVEEAAVVDYEDEGFEKPIAFVAPTKEATPGDELAKTLAFHAKDELARYKFPRRVAFVEALPRNDRGKIERKTLRERARKAGFTDWHDTETDTLRAAREET
jgi:benzoate-CoA ligase family protein